MTITYIHHLSAFVCLFAVGMFRFRQDVFLYIAHCASLTNGPDLPAVMLYGEPVAASVGGSRIVPRRLKGCRAFRHASCLWLVEAYIPCVSRHFKCPYFYVTPHRSDQLCFPFFVSLSTCSTVIPKYNVHSSTYLLLLQSSSSGYDLCPLLDCAAISPRPLRA